MRSFAASLFLSLVGGAFGVTSDIHLLIYETDTDPSSSIIKEQALNIPGIQTTIIGSGSKFEGFGSKYESVLPVLSTMDADSLVVLSDSRDVLINDPERSRSYNKDGVSAAVQNFREEFEALTQLYPGAIVASAESQCCVSALTHAEPGDYFGEDGHRSKRACNSVHESCEWNGADKVVPWENMMKELALQHMGTGADMYLNAGLITGKAGDMLRALQTADIQVSEDDQAVLTDFMYRWPDHLILDYNRVLFGNNRHSSQGCMFQLESNAARLVHKESGTSPLFIHSPGGFMSCHESLAMQLSDELSQTGAASTERRKLQDWKRHLTNNYPPVCNYICPANSYKKPHVKCLSAFGECQCNPGYVRNAVSETCELKPPVCNYVCPANSYKKANVKCLDTFGECACNPGYVKNTESETCELKQKDEKCNFVCPANSKVKRNVKCLDSFNDCACKSGFKPNVSTKSCVLKDAKCDYVCPKNSYVKPNIKCLDSFNDCACKSGFKPNVSTKSCVRNTRTRA